MSSLYVTDIMDRLSAHWEQTVDSFEGAQTRLWQEIDYIERCFDGHRIVNYAAFARTRKTLTRPMALTPEETQYADDPLFDAIRKPDKIGAALRRFKVQSLAYHIIRQCHGAGNAFPNPDDARLAPTIRRQIAVIRHHANLFENNVRAAINPRRPLPQTRDGNCSEQIFEALADRLTQVEIILQMRKIGLVDDTHPLWVKMDFSKSCPKKWREAYNQAEEKFLENMGHSHPGQWREDYHFMMMGDRYSSIRDWLFWADGPSFELRPDGADSFLKKVMTTIDTDNLENPMDWKGSHIRIDIRHTPHGPNLYVWYKLLPHEVESPVIYSQIADDFLRFRIPAHYANDRRLQR